MQDSGKVSVSPPIATKQPASRKRRFVPIAAGLLYPVFGGLHARHRPVGHSVPDYDVGPVNTVPGPVEP